MLPANSSCFRRSRYWAVPVLTCVRVRVDNKSKIWVLLNCVGMDDGRIKGRYTADAGQISRRIIHGISM